MPWHTAYATTGLVSGNARFMLGASGHIVEVINPPARRKGNYQADGKLGPDSDAWIAGARPSSSGPR